MRDVTPALQKHLAGNRGFKGGRIHFDLIKNYIAGGGKLAKDCLAALLLRTTYILQREPNLAQIDGKVTIIGDIHGRLHDMINFLEETNRRNPEHDKLLFLGDYVDRGAYSWEVVAYLCCLKLERPKDVVLLRGNHETRGCTDKYGFRLQVLREYDHNIYDLTMELFDQLPIAAVVNQRIFAVHGGVTEGLTDLDKINRLHRAKEPVQGSIMEGLLWNDPFNERLAYSEDYVQNLSRHGTGFAFGYGPLTQFLNRSGL